MTSIANPFCVGLARWREEASRRINVAELTEKLHFEERGLVRSTADGIARITGLPRVRLNELLHFAGGQLGYAASLEENHIECVLLDECDTVSAGQTVKRSDTVVQVPVGPALLGRVVDPLGRPLDGGPPIDAQDWLPAERPAPTILERAAVREPVHCGTLVIDAMFPLGRGQRELIIGDRGTGKTSLAVDALIAQRDSELISVYVAIGQKSESASSVIEAIRKHGAPERSIFVVATGSDAPGLQWLAPFSAMSMAEYFRDRGGHALLVIDDLSNHAATHRELALLMQQPPGREAYPGDIFHVHARLLERAAMLSQAQGGGSLTALPIAQTEAGNLAAYIPTNLISITDGQIVLDAKMFYRGQLPAVDTGLSVSRVGGKTQLPTMRAAVSSLRLDYAQFQELEMFTRFGAELDTHVREQIERGHLIRAALAQPRLEPQSATLQLAVILALQAGFFDNHQPDEIAAAIVQLDRELIANPALQTQLSSNHSSGSPAQHDLQQTLRALLSPASPSVETAPAF